MFILSRFAPIVKNGKGVIFIGLSKNGKVMGRPTADPKKHETRIRMTDEDVQLLEFCAKETGFTKTEIIRQGIREIYAKLKK